MATVFEVVILRERDDSFVWRTIAGAKLVMDREVNKSILGARIRGFAEHQTSAVFTSQLPLSIFIHIPPRNIKG